MKLFAAPKTTALEDGSIRIEAQAITTDYVDSQINIIETVGKLDFDKVIKVIRESKNIGEAKKNLISQFDITDSIANYLLGMELSQVDNYLNNVRFRDAEIAKWKALKEII